MSSLQTTQVFDRYKIKRFCIFLLALTALTLAFCFLFKTIVSPILIASALAYIFIPLVEYLESKLKVPRLVVVAGMMIIFLVILITLSIVLAPIAYEQAKDLIRLIPQTINRFIMQFSTTTKDILSQRNLVDPELLEKAFAEFHLLNDLAKRVPDWGSRVWQSTPRVIGGVVHIALIPVFLFFLLLEAKKIKNWFKLLVPRDLTDLTRFVAKKIDLTLRSVVKGQFLVAFVHAISYAIGLSLTGLYGSLVIGLLAGFCRLVPYLDLIIGLPLSFLVAVSDFQGWGQIAGIAIVFLSMQALDATVVTPKVMGERAGLHPAVIFSAVIAFGDVFGFYGVILAVPVLAVIRVIWRMMKPVYFGSQFYDPFLD